MEAIKKPQQEKLYSDRCKTCAHWKKLEESEYWGKCKEPELKFWLVSPTPDYFGCLWYQPKLPEKLKNYQVKLIS